jgi:galactonate dehydratase
MKIARVKIYLIASGKLHPVIVEIVTDEGVSGIGEAAIAYGLGGTATAGMVKDLSERMLIGRDPFRIEEIWSEMYDHSFWAKGGGPIVFAAISAIEQALWDVKGFSAAGCATACTYMRTAGTARLRRPPSLPRRRNARCATGTMR